jgi:hypothetical protein
MNNEILKLVNRITLNLPEYPIGAEYNYADDCVGDILQIELKEYKNTRSGAYALALTAYGTNSEKRHEFVLIGAIVAEVLSITDKEILFVALCNYINAKSK